MVKRTELRSKNRNDCDGKSSSRGVVQIQGDWSQRTVETV